MVEACCGFCSVVIPLPFQYFHTRKILWLKKFLLHISYILLQPSNNGICSSHVLYYFLLHNFDLNNLKKVRLFHFFLNIYKEHHLLSVTSYFAIFYLCYPLMQPFIFQKTQKGESENNCDHKLMARKIWHSRNNVSLKGKIELYTVIQWVTSMKLWAEVEYILEWHELKSNCQLTESFLNIKQRKAHVSKYPPFCKHFTVMWTTGFENITTLADC